MVAGSVCSGALEKVVLGFSPDLSGGAGLWVKDVLGEETPHSRQLWFPFSVGSRAREGILPPTSLR